MWTIELVNNAINNSTMDKSKIYAMLQVSVIIPTSLAGKNGKQLTSYAKYCNNTDSNSCQWCSNPSQVSYDQGVYAKQNYKGIILRQLDTDDYGCYCGCGQFPVTNQIINGWESSTFTSCPKLD
ncbi:uncharacterized protein LOC113550023 [Rhopalosiphum maidis]|uniref:uncharacterized protein LOC113550023 n=1 Tax=Rhopalosiphum maidis TaxID=43146 RepID=UPI000EFEA9C0|nr:uncharacterized protein LOC113550023 [Rhopalosiphum maidis]